MKKYSTFLLCICMILCLTACGQTPVADNETTSTLLSKSATISVVDGGSLAYTAKVAYANASADTRILTDSLNSDLMVEDSVQHLPIYKFETVSELQAFKATFADALSFDRGYNEIPSFDSYAAEYDDAFFESRALILCYVQASSGSYRYGIADVSVNGDALCLYVKQLNHPQVCTADVQGWFMLAEVSKADIEKCSRFDAQMTSSNVLDSVTADYDGDGEPEEIVLTDGPTSGLYTIGVTVRDGDAETSSYFLPAQGLSIENRLTARDGKVFLSNQENDELVFYEIAVSDGTVVLQSGDKTLPHWGTDYRVCAFSVLTGTQGSEQKLSEEDNGVAAVLIGQQEYRTPSYDNLYDVIIRDALGSETIYYDSDAGILTMGDSAAKLSDEDRESWNRVLSRYIMLGSE